MVRDTFGASVGGRDGDEGDSGVDAAVARAAETASLPH